MDRLNNPYVPGAGLQPPELAGRDRLLSEASIDMDRVLAGRPAKGLTLRTSLRTFASVRRNETAMTTITATEARSKLYRLMDFAAESHEPGGD